MYTRHPLQQAVVVQLMARRHTAGTEQDDLPAIVIVTFAQDRNTV